MSSKRFLKNLLLTIVLAFCICAVASAALAPDCGLVVTRKGATNPATRLWVLHSQLVYEVPGGLSLAPSKLAPSFPFQSSKEKIITAYDDPAISAVFLFTSKTRGFSIYRWDYGDPTKSGLTLVTSQTPSYSWNGKTIFSPLVDAVVVAPQVYLLTNFHWITLNLSDIEAGQYRPQKTEELPFCTTIDGSCSRGVGIYLLGSKLMVARMHPSTGNKVNGNLGFDLSTNPPTWTLDDFKFDAQAYVNILKTHVTSLKGNDRLTTLASATNDGILSFLFPKELDVQAPVALAKLKNYVVAASLPSTLGFPGFNGILALQDEGTYYYKNGKPLCRVFQAMKTIVAFPEGNSIKVTAVTDAGDLLTVNVGI